MYIYLYFIYVFSYVIWSSLFFNSTAAFPFKTLSNPVAVILLPLPAKRCYSHLNSATLLPAETARMKSNWALGA